MPSTNDSLENLFAQARRDIPPDSDVSARVLRTLRVREVIADRPLLIIALTSTLAATVAILFLFASLENITDPFLELYSISPLLKL